MALPLLWLGAAVVGAVAANELANRQKKSDLERKGHVVPEDLSDIGENESYVGKYPAEWFNQDIQVKPEIGSLVCCGIGGVLDHTGIWIGDDTIVELDGNGLVKGLSPHRFLHDRSGSKIFVACDSKANPLASDRTAEIAASRIFEYREYDLIKNNCHKFAWQCISDSDDHLTTFADLNKKMAALYNRKIYWDLADI